MLDYTTIDLDTQLAHITSELPSADLLSRKAAMWTQAGSALSAAEQNFSTATKNLAPDWQDPVGERWLESSEESLRTLSTWSQIVNQNNPSPDLTAVSAAIPTTHDTVLKFKKIADALKPLASNPVMGAAIQAILLQLQQAAGAVMNKLAKDYATAGEKVAAAGSGGPWAGIQGGIAGGSPSASTLSGGGRLMGVGGSAGQDAASLGGGLGDGLGDVSGAGQDGAAGDMSGADVGEVSDVDSTSPELSGGGGLAPPAAPPTVSPTPPAAPPATAAPGGVPIVPMGGAGLGRGGVRSGGGVVRMPSVAAPRTGPTHIPVAAPPVNPLTAPAPAAAPPAVPQQLVPPTAATGTSGAGGVPPLMPMMGAAGLGRGLGGGSAEGIGAGLARRPVRRPDDEDSPTPGLPAVLSGKAGVTDPFAAAVRQRASDAPDAPATVEFIDEELWQRQHAAPAGAGRETR